MPSSLTIRKPEKLASIRESVALEMQSKVTMAEALVVTPANLGIAGALMLDMRAMRNRWAELWDPYIEDAQEAKRREEVRRKKAVEDKDLMDKPAALAEANLATRIGEVSAAVEAARLAEEQRLQAEQTARVEAEALATAIALTEAAKTAEGPVAEVLLEQAEQALEEPNRTVVTVTVARTAPKIQGFSQPETWAAEIHDLKALLRALIDGKLDKVLTPDLEKRIREAVMPPLNQLAKALRSALNIPGVRAKSVKGYRLG